MFSKQNVGMYELCKFLEVPCEEYVHETVNEWSKQNKNLKKIGFIKCIYCKNVTNIVFGNI